MIEELPPGKLERTGSGRSTSRRKNQDAPGEVAAQGQQLIAEAMASFAATFDARRLTTEGFRLAEEILASQKEFALRVVDAITRPRQHEAGGASTRARRLWAASRRQRRPSSLSRRGT